MDPHFYTGEIFRIHIHDQEARKPLGSKFLRILLLLKKIVFNTPLHSLEEKIEVFLVEKIGQHTWNPHLHICRRLECSRADWDQNQKVGGQESGKE